MTLIPKCIGAVVLAWLMLASPSALANADRETLAAQLDALIDAGFSEKSDIVNAMIEQPQARTGVVLEALLERHLYAHDNTRQVVIIASTNAVESIHDALTGEALENMPADVFSSIRTNTRLRKAIKGALAILQLKDPDADVRLAAVDEMLRTLDQTTIDALRAAEPGESDKRVAEAIHIGLALADLESDDKDVRLNAVNALSSQLKPKAYNRLQDLLETETDPLVKKSAEAAISRIESMRSLFSGIETLFFGLSLGSVLLLAAIGLAITFGVMGVINMAHGELIMLGAYTTYVMQLLLPNHIALALLLSIPAAFLVSGLVGVAIERGIVRHLYGRPLETLLATFGLSLVLQQTVRSIFSPLNRSVSTPEFMSGVWQVNDALALTLNRLYIIAFALLVFALVQLLMNRTTLGLQVRAVSQNRRMARAIGIRSARIDALTFGLGSGIAGVAGVALSQLTNVGPNLGQAYIIDSFMVVVFGGVGNLWGTLISGFSLGVINKLLEPHAGAVLAKILVLIALIAFIQRRPQGLFPPRGRAAEGH